MYFRHPSGQAISSRSLITCGLSIVMGGMALVGYRSAADAPSRLTVEGQTVAQATSPTINSTEFSDLVQPFLVQHCTHCHNAKRLRGDLNLEPLAQASSVPEDEALLERIEDMLAAGEMPPKKRPRPDSAEQARVMEWVGNELARRADSRQDDPGRVTARRLNRKEYNNTVRDLLGADFKPADDFPPDDSGYGFDNIGDVLSMSPLLMEKYMRAAEEIVEKVIIEKDELPSFLRCAKKHDRHGTACARKLLGTLARRAYRRTVKPSEVRRLVRLVNLAQREGDSFETGLGLAVQAILVSPHFLFRIEGNSAPNDPGSVHYINDFELASRLSYFLWSTMPDDTLLDLAQEKGLRHDDALENQVRRMLAHEKSEAFVENFAGQWLELRNLEFVFRDSKLFKQFTGLMRRAMARETLMFFRAIVSEDRSILEFLDADFTFVNERLAKHYGIPGVEGKNFRRVKLTGDERGGLLTQASVLTITSYPTRTSPVLRGRWILENILGAPPAPPPDGVPDLKETKVASSATLRERLELHRADASCAVCHDRIDPLGFGLENYDAIGAWRTHDGEAPIDASGELPDGTTFNGPRELKRMLLGRSEEFTYCLTEKMLTYALGRGLERFDRNAVEAIRDDVARNDYRFSALVLGIVKSMPFQMRRGEDASG